MNKEEALELISDYLDTLKIMHSEPEEDDENNTEILFITEGKDSPGGFIESAITFSDNCILARAYYNTVGQKLVTTNLERFPSLFRLLNVINEVKNHLSIQQHSTHFDDDEERSAIFCPQLRMTEDGNHDIKYQLIVDYHYLDLFPNETSQMLVVFLQLYLNSFAPAVFGVLTGEMNLYEAKNTVTNADKKMAFPENYIPTEEDENNELS